MAAKKLHRISKSGHFVEFRSGECSDIDIALPYSQPFHRRRRKQCRLLRPCSGIGGMPRAERRRDDLLFFSRRYSPFDRGGELLIARSRFAGAVKEVDFGPAGACQLPASESKAVSAC